MNGVRQATEVSADLRAAEQATNMATQAADKHVEYLKKTGRDAEAELRALHEERERLMDTLGVRERCLREVVGSCEAALDAMMRDKVVLTANDYPEPSMDEGPRPSRFG